ncbi:MAG: DNA polymerase I [Fimbriimonadaceae bacterium]
MTQPKRLLVLDAYSLLFRAFFATGFLSTADGRPTNALFGFLNMFLTLLQQEQPDAVVVAFDAPGKTFRHAEFPDYKGTRKETAPELIAQFPVARELVTILGVPSIELTGYEADDIIGTISLQAERNGYDTYIVTGDLDSLQLVDDHVRVVTNKVGVSQTVTYDLEAVHARYGFGPEYVPDYKALVGDTSDNIPGVPGIGDKSAKILITQFGHIENLLEQFDQVEAKFAKKIEPFKEQLIKSKWLATIDRNAPLEYDFASYAVSEAQFESGKKFLDSLEMRSLLKRYEKALAPYVTDGEGAIAHVESVIEQLATLSHSIADFEQLRSWVGDRQYALYVDTAPRQHLLEEDSVTTYIAIDREVASIPHAWAMSLFESTSAQAIVHDAKPLFHLAPNAGVPVYLDTYLASFVLQPGRSSYSLRDLIGGFLESAPPTTPEEVAVALGRLAQPLIEKLTREDQLPVLRDIELPLTPILARMEKTGIAVNSGFFSEYSKELQSEIERVQQLVYEYAGQEFNIASPKQLGEVLFERLGIPGVKKTKTGYATGAEILLELAAEYPIAGAVLNWRELTKLKSTYVDALPRMIAQDGRIHTNYNQAGAATGRLSSNDPNLQNIPIRTELGRRIRTAFVAANGFTLGSFDYSQIELRLLAHMCRDDSLVDAFNRGQDVHAITAALMFNEPERSVTKEQRRLAKMLNYAVLYGVTDYGLANQLGAGFGVSEARALMQQYFERFPSVKAFTESVVTEARSKGYTKTLMGRRRYFPDIHAQNRNERLAAERQAVNAPIQGSAADMIKIAMIDVAKALEGHPSRMLLQVHDELVFEVATGDEGIIDPIREKMQSALPLTVPVTVDAKLGPNWNEMTLR